MDISAIDHVMPITSRPPVLMVEGSGSRLRDSEGREYLDFVQGWAVNCLGHGHPAVVWALTTQAQRLINCSPSYHNAPMARLATLVAQSSGLEHVFFTNGGAEATENAIRMARLHTGRQKVLAAYRSYHGATAGSITLTGDPRRWPSEPGLPGVVHYWGPYLYRSAFHSTTEQEETERALHLLRDLLMVEGAHTVAAIILESVVGTNCILVPPPGYLEGVRAICDEHGIVMIADEVMSGFGRCGEWFAIDHWGVTPDLICFAKGVNSGYVPLGGVVISERIAQTFDDRPYPGGLTYSGHPLACASAVASIEIFKEENVIEHARSLGA